jgi:hypothetical protein
MRLCRHFLASSKGLLDPLRAHSLIALFSAAERHPDLPAAPDHVRQTLALETRWVAPQ